MVIRKFSGGYHANHASVCLIVSTGLLGICLYIVTCADSNWILHTFSAVAGINIAINSPIDSENRKLTDAEVRHYRHMTRIIVAAMITAYTVLAAYQLERYSICVAVSLILSALLQMPCIVGKCIEKRKRVV